MSFNADTARAKDLTRPLGLRVVNLYHCLERFNLFGFQATRERLRIQIGANRQGWTSQQIVDSLALLTSAPASWLNFARTEAVKRRTLKQAGRRQPDQDCRLLQLSWLDAYLQGDTPTDLANRRPRARVPTAVMPLSETRQGCSSKFTTLVAGSA